MCTSFSALKRIIVWALASDTELLDKRQVGVTILLGDVLKQALALADELQKRPASGEIMLMGFHMLGQLGDTGSHDRDLHGRRTAVLVMGL